MREITGDFEVLEIFWSWEANYLFNIFYGKRTSIISEWAGFLEG